MGLKINALQQVQAKPRLETNAASKTTQVSVNTKNGNQSVTDKKVGLDLAGGQNKLGERVEVKVAFVAQREIG